MADLQRPVSPQKLPGEEENIEQKLRPEKLTDFIG